MLLGLNCKFWGPEWDLGETLEHQIPPAEASLSWEFPHFCTWGMPEWILGRSLHPRAPPFSCWECLREFPGDNPCSGELLGSLGSKRAPKFQGKAPKVSSEQLHPSLAWEQEFLQGEFNFLEFEEEGAAKQIPKNPNVTSLSRARYPHRVFTTPPGTCREWE